jgi:hypothetical protein
MIIVFNRIPKNSKDISTRDSRIFLKTNGLISRDSETSTRSINLTKAKIIEKNEIKDKSNSPDVNIN